MLNKNTSLHFRFSPCPADEGGLNMSKKEKDTKGVNEAASLVLEF